MVRLFVVGMLLLLVAEVVAALFFLVGYYWVGGLVWGVGLAVAAVLVFLVLPLVGELVLQYDSRLQEWKVRLSWWARAQVIGSEAPELRVRVLGILPYRKKMKPKKEAPSVPEPKTESKAERSYWVRRNLPGLMRLALAGLQAGQEMIGEARALAVTINAPAQADVVDQIIAGVIGHRPLGPVDLKVLPEGPRRIRLLYRVPMRVVAAAGLYLLVQGRAVRVARALKRGKKT